MKAPLILAALIALALLATSASAGMNDFLGVRPLGMGGAHRAVVTGNDSIFLNPAGMALFKRYSFETQYLLTPEYEQEDGPTEHVFNISVVDNQVTPLATGLSYTRIERGGSKKGNRYDLANAYMLTENLLVGTNVKYLQFEREGKSDINAVTVDVGMLLRFDFGLSLAVAGYNLTNTADYMEHPICMAVGIMYWPFRSLSLSFDWFTNFQKPVDPEDPIGDKTHGFSYGFGAEYLLMGQVLLRAGAAIDQARPWGDEYYWSVGAGYVDPRFGLNFSYQGSFHHGWGGIFAVGLRLHM
ncbi:MAG: hypothetical protein JXR96_27890 [Deltaproteobacteria bacterium]|nr:hypothetical protein [Deltaproteobacteria bacterium]